VALISLTVALNGVSDRKWLTACVGLLIVVTAMTVFVWLSNHHAKTLFKLDVFHDPGFLYSFLSYILLQFSNVGINFLLPNYVQTVDGATAFIGGLILLPGSVFNGLGQPVYGWMLDHFGGRLPLFLGNTLFTLGVLGFTIFGRHISVLWVTILYLIFAIGRSMAFGNSTAYGLKVIQPDDQSDANALYSTGQQVTGSMGTTVLAGMMTAVTIPGLSHAQNVGIGSQLAFGLLLAIGILNFWLYARLFKLTSTKKVE
jgi:MFS family permease